MMTAPAPESQSPRLSSAYSVAVREERLSDGTPWFVANHPDLPGCMSDGASPEEAIANLAEARAFYLATLAEDGLRVPFPSTR